VKRFPADFWCAHQPGILAILAEMEPVFTQDPLRNAGKSDEVLGRAD